MDQNFKIVLKTFVILAVIGGIWLIGYLMGLEIGQKNLAEQNSESLNSRPTSNGFPEVPEPISDGNIIQLNNQPSAGFPKPPPLIK